MVVGGKAGAYYAAARSHQKKKAQPKPLSEESNFDCAFDLQALSLHSKATHTLLQATSKSYIDLIYLSLNFFGFLHKFFQPFTR